VELQGVQGPAREVRHGEQNALRGNEQHDGADEDVTLAFHLHPDIAVQGDYGAGSKNTGFSGDAHVG
jgi:hypothetical protein